MSDYREGDNDPLYRDQTATRTRDEDPTAVHQPYQPPPHQQHQQYPYQQGHPGQWGSPSPQQYGYGGHPGYGSQFGPWMRPRRQFPIETKPFFLTSEFVGALLAIAGIAITAASSEAFGAWRAWILITAVLVGYMVSRGIAKSGTRSHSTDPRENIDLNWGRSED